MTGSKTQTDAMRKILDTIRSRALEDVRRTQFREKWTAEQRARAEHGIAMMDTILAAASPRETTTIEHDPGTGCDGATTCALYGSGQGPTCQAAARPLWLVRPAEDPAPDWCPLRSGDVLVRRPR